MVLIFAISGAFVAVGWLLNAKHTATWRGAVPAQLRVVRIQSTTVDFSTVYRPVFETQLNNGERIQSAPELWSYPSVHDVGDVVDGFYNPETGQLTSNKIRRKSLRFGRVFMIVGGVIGIIFGGLFWSITQSPRPRKRRRS